MARSLFVVGGIMADEMDERTNEANPTLKLTLIMHKYLRESSLVYKLTIWRHIKKLNRIHCSGLETNKFNFSPSVV